MVLFLLPYNDNSITLGGYNNNSVITSLGQVANVILEGGYNGNIAFTIGEYM